MKKETACLWILLCLCLLVGCGVSGQGGTDAPEEELAVRPASGVVCHSIIACKYIVFEPDDFTENYKNGDAYAKGIDAWTQLRYSDAEENFLMLEKEMQETGPAFPEDRAFLCEALGCLYIDMAKYQSAYEYLLDAYVTMKEIYTQDPYYQNAVSAVFCHYYYALGDYGRCAREVQSLLDNQVTDNPTVNRADILREFLTVILNNISAQISFDCGRYSDAWNTYTESLEMCQAAKDAYGDDGSFMTAMQMNIFECMGDTAYRLGMDYREAAITTFYDGALKILESKFSEPLADAVKARILAKKGYCLAGFEGKANEGLEIVADALQIQEELYSIDEPYPGLVDTYLKYGDILGFIYYDREGAETYYNKALALSLSAYGDNHPETAKVYETLGRFYGNRVQDGQAQAIVFLQQALEICKNLLTEDTALVANIELQLAGAYKITGDDASSDLYKEQALVIYEKLGIHLAGTAEAEEE